MLERVTAVRTTVVRAMTRKRVGVTTNIITGGPHDRADGNVAAAANRWAPSHKNARALRT